MQVLQTLSQDEEEEVHGEVSRIVLSIQKSKATPLTDRITVADGLQGYQPRRRVGHAGGKKKIGCFPRGRICCVWH